MVHVPLSFIHLHSAQFETYRLETSGGGLVVKLSVEGAEFGMSSEPTDNDNGSRETVGGHSMRMILTLKDPDTVFGSTLRAGASQIFPVGEDFGWRLGRIANPFGLHWEIGHPLK